MRAELLFSRASSYKFRPANVDRKKQIREGRLPLDASQSYCVVVEAKADEALVGGFAQAVVGSFSLGQAVQRLVCTPKSMCAYLQCLSTFLVQPCVAFLQMVWSGSS